MPVIRCRNVRFRVPLSVLQEPVDYFHKVFSVAVFLEGSDTADLSEGFDALGFLYSQQMKGLV